MPRRIRPVLAVGATALIAAVAVTAEASPARVVAKRGQCSGVTSLRTLAISPRRHVNLTPIRTTIKALASKRRPERIRHGQSAFERQTFEVIAQVTLDRRTLNNTIQLTLFDGGSYMRAVLPPLQCITARTPGRLRIASARYRYAGDCGIPGLEWEPSGTVAYVTGVGFWGPTHGRGVAPNGASLAPVTKVELVAGCGTD